MTAAVANLKDAVIGYLLVVQDFTLLSWRTVGNLFRPPFYGRETILQMDRIGVGSLFIVVLTGMFTGMVLALQSHSGFARFNAESAIATVVVLSVTRELGPVLAGLMVAGRIGAAMAADTSPPALVHASQPPSSTATRVCPIQRSIHHSRAA